MPHKTTQANALTPTRTLTHSLALSYALTQRTNERPSCLCTHTHSHANTRTHAYSRSRSLEQARATAAAAAAAADAAVAAELLTFYCVRMSGSETNRDE